MLKILLFVSERTGEFCAEGVIRERGREGSDAYTHFSYIKASIGSSIIELALIQNSQFRAIISISSLAHTAI
jgi:hypothetical protein